MRRGHVAPQNTFLDTIIRKFEGQSEWGRGLRGGGSGGCRVHPSVDGGGVPGPVRLPSASQWGLARGLEGKAWCRGLWAWGQGAWRWDAGRAAQLRFLGLGSVCDTLSVQGREMGWERCRHP